MKGFGLILMNSSPRDGRPSESMITCTYYCSDHITFISSVLKYLVSHHLHNHCIRYSNPEVPEWAGYDPDKWMNTNLYPNEVASDFAYLPFGGGARKCVGDEFATLEATVTLAMVLRRFEFEFDSSKLAETDVDIMAHPEDLNHAVGMRTGATIHTRKGLHMVIRKREL